MVLEIERASINPSIESFPNVKPILTSNGGGSSVECPLCDIEYIFSYATILAAQKEANESFNLYVKQRKGIAGNQDFIEPLEFLPTGRTLPFGEGVRTDPRGGKGNLSVSIEFDQTFHVDENYTEIRGTGTIYLEANANFSNITSVERVRFSENATGGSRPEGLIRFQNSEGRIIANLSFGPEWQVRKFWEFYYTKQYNHTLENLVRKYDREHGTNYKKSFGFNED